MKKIYIDGQAGTTGLQIHDRLKNRTDLELLEIEEGKRKDPKARRALMEQAIWSSCVCLIRQPKKPLN